MSLHLRSSMADPQLAQVRISSSGSSFSGRTDEIAGTARSLPYGSDAGGSMGGSRLLDFSDGHGHPWWGVGIKVVDPLPAGPAEQVGPSRRLTRVGVRLEWI